MAASAAGKPAEDPAGIPRPGWLSHLVGRWWFWVVFVLAMFTLIIARTVTRVPPPVPKVLFTIPTFELTSQDGQAFGTKQLAGKVWVANFIFTSCPGPCPELTKRMQYLQHHTRNAAQAVHLVTFTVDPENDTPQKLADYGRAHRYNPVRWTFLTGDTKTVEETIVKGFKLAMGAEAPGQIFHSERFVLVDRRGGVRGLYEATDQGMAALLRDIGVVLNKT